jgi:hypothetical protein
LVPDLVSDHSNIAAKGIVTTICLNYTSYGLGGPHTKPYHVFPAFIEVNMTQILWTTDGLNNSLDSWKDAYYSSQGVILHDIRIAYDASDVPILELGQTVEFSGYYERVSCMVNSHFVTISPNINGSYWELADFPAPDVKPISPHYLNNVPDLFGNFSETQIFLLAASPRYGYCKETVKQNYFGFPDINKGDPVFIINVTLRNDYTEDNPPPGGFGYNNASIIIMKTQLYGKNGTIDASDVTPPYPGGLHTSAQSYSIKRGETISFDIYMLTDNREIDSYELSIYYIYSWPMP